MLIIYMFSEAGHTSVSSRCYSFGIPGYLWNKKIYQLFTRKFGVSTEKCYQLVYVPLFCNISVIITCLVFTVVFHISLRNLSLYCTSTLNECI